MYSSCAIFLNVQNVNLIYSLSLNLYIFYHVFFKLLFIKLYSNFIACISAQNKE